ncbi:anaphase promoting complex subunit 5, partial [Linnemannia zychae]
MSGRRSFVRTATDISIRPPQTQTFTGQDGIAEEYDNIHNIHAGPDSVGRGRPMSEPIQVVLYLSPHKVSILILIEFFCRSRCPPDISQQLLLFLLDSIQDPSEHLHHDVNKFGNRIKNEVGAFLWNHLKNTLRRIRSPYHLHNFFLYNLEHDPEADPNGDLGQKIGLADLIHDPNTVMEPSSVLGLYVRKAKIEFKKLSFEEVCKFYSAFEIYSSKLNESDRSLPEQRESPPSSGSIALMSISEVEKYLDMQTDKLSDPSQADIPPELLAHVYEIQSRWPSLAKAHYTICLHAQQTGDFEIAIQSLYRFFDYCISMHDQVLYQYALLNLAMLHARFSNFDQALIALEETIEMARSQMDQECLGYASNWLYRLTRAISGNGLDMNKARILSDFTGDMDDQTSQYLASLNELDNAKQMQGESTPQALESLVKASSLNTRHSLEGVGGVVQLFQSKIWSAYGNHPLSSLYSQLQLKYHSSEINMSDASTGYTKHASDLALNGHFKEALGVIEHIKIKFPLDTLKAAPWVQTLIQILQRKAMSSNNLPAAEIWTQQLGTTLFNTPRLESSLKRSSSNKGRHESHNTRSSDSSNISSGIGSIQDGQLDDTNLELQLNILLQKALLSVLMGQRESGVDQLSDGLAILQENQWPGMHKFTIMYLLTLAEIYMESGNAIAAMPLLLTASTFSENSYQRPLLLLVKLRLAEVLLYLDSVQQARDLIDSIMSM